MTPVYPQWTRWQKSTRSDSGSCVEIGYDQHDVAGAIRDSKNPGGPVLTGINIKELVHGISAS